MRLILFPFRLAIGLVLFLVSPGFRDTVRRKALSQVGEDDTVGTGETVIAVLQTPTGKEVIGS